MNKLVAVLVVVFLLIGALVAGGIYWASQNNLLNLLPKNTDISITNDNVNTSDVPQVTEATDSKTEDNSKEVASDYILICPSGWIENVTSVSKSCANPAMNQSGFSSAIMLTVADLGIQFAAESECNKLASQQVEEVNASDNGSTTKIIASTYGTKPYLNCKVELESSTGAANTMITYQKYVQKLGDDKMYLLQGMYGNKDAADMMLVRSAIDSLIIK